MTDGLNENFLRVKKDNVTNNSDNSNESPLRINKREARGQIFVERLGMYISPDIEKNLENLRGLIDENLFKQFEIKVAQILEQNPGSEAIVAQETEKLGIGAQIAMNQYNSGLLGIVEGGANDNVIIPTQRIYGGKGTPQIEQDAA